ncbi:MAG: class I SAM-dependent DNA methyltransferase [Nitrospiria bacterium]
MVEAEHKNLGYAGRFGPGLPRVSDGSMLFLMHLVRKMEAPENGGGRVGIVLSGESEIRRWLLEQDFVEAIVALSTDMFFNTGIGTYVWILSNKKAKHRKGKVQLINLSDTWSAMRKSEGTKRRFLAEDQINDAVREYEAFEEGERSKIFNTTDFTYRKVAPLKAKLTVTPERVASLKEAKAFQKLEDAYETAWTVFFDNHLGDHAYDWAEEIVKQHNKIEEFGKNSKALATAFINAFIERDENAKPVRDTKGKLIPDTSLNDNESVPFAMSVEEYFNTEVFPHVPDAYIDEAVRDAKDGEIGIVGYEINFNRYFYHAHCMRSTPTSKPQRRVYRPC